MLNLMKSSQIDSSRCMQSRWCHRRIPPVNEQQQEKQLHCLKNDHKHKKLGSECDELEASFDLQEFNLGSDIMPNINYEMVWQLA